LYIPIYLYICTYVHIQICSYTDMYIHIYIKIHIGTYIPDFTAHIESSTIRVLRINIHSDDSNSIPTIEKRMKELNIWHDNSLPTPPMNTSPRNTQQKLSPMYQKKTYNSPYGLLSCVSNDGSVPTSPVCLYIHIDIHRYVYIYI
jgi:hypothetical protein